MLPQFYQTQLQSRLNPTQYLTLQLLVGLLQFHQQVIGTPDFKSVRRDDRMTALRIEPLAALFAEPILFESRRRNIQRFLQSPQLSVVLLWCPIIEH